MKKFQISFVGINSLYGSTSALLLKQSPFIKCLKLFDPRDVENGLDIANINTQCRVKTFQGHEQLENAFREADIIVISDESSEIANSDSHLMNASANLTKYAKAISRASPDAIIVVASPPVNCLLPIMSQLLAKAGCYNHNKVVGTTSVDTVRASALLASHLNMDPKEVVLPVIGGGSELTRVPVFSQSRPHFSLKKDVKTNLIMDIRRGDSLVLANKGSPEALNRAYSTVRFLNSIMAGLRGDPNVTDITLCRTDLVPGVEYFSLPVMFGREGIIRRFGVPNTTATEDEMVEEAIKNVKKDIDKAEYIVKGTIELPEHKYLSVNDRASSQKDMFDLFVKCLPKSETNQPVAENGSTKATDYSFKSLIKGDTARDPFEVFDKKSQRHTTTTLKHVSSPDSFLKSAGCYTSPMQKPILILEPLGCPSRPMKADADEELDEFLDAEDVLHENNLARFREKETYCNHQNLDPSPTKHQPFLSTERNQQITVDPIANFKAQVAKLHGYQRQNKDPADVSNTVTQYPEEIKMFNDAEPESHNTKPTTAVCIGSNADNEKSNKSKDEIRPTTTDSTNKRPAVSNRKEVIFSSPSGRCMKKRYDSPNKVDNFVFDVKTNRFIPPYNLYKKGKSPKVDYIPEEENGRSYMPPCEMEESLYNRGRLGGVENDEKYNKLVSRLLKKLDGLKGGSYFPLKTLGEDRTNAPKCKKSFTESAVRCRSPNSVSLKTKKYKKAMESSDQPHEPQEMKFSTKKIRPSEEHEVLESTGQSEKSIRYESSQFKEIDHGSSNNSLNEESKQVNNNEEFHFECPKFQITVTCQPDKNGKESKSRTSERTACDIPQDDGKHKRNVIMKSYKARDYKTHDKMFANKTPIDSSEQEERLKRLREKINKKLVPMMRQSGHEKPTEKEDASAPLSMANPAKDVDIINSKTQVSNVGVPLVVVQNAESCPKSSGSPKLRSKSNEKWQGVPFIVKRNEKTVENNDGKNRAVFMKVVVPSAYREEPKSNDEPIKSQKAKSNVEMEEEVDNVIKDQPASKNTGEKSSAAPSRNGKTSKRAVKVMNKLQLLELEGSRKMNVEETSRNERSEKDIDKFHKERIRREINMDLNAKEVRNYMMTRQRGSRKVLVSESSNQVEAKSEAVPEQVDAEHFKSDTTKDISPDVFSEPKLSQNNPIKTAANEADKREQSSSARIDNVECSKPLESGTSAKEAMKDVGEPEPGKKTAEPRMTMTSPSKKFENIEERIQVDDSKMNPSLEASIKNLQLEQKSQQPDKKSTTKSESAKISEPNFFISHKTRNKLQLLAKARTSKNSDQNAFKIKLQRKIKNVWEKVLSDKPVQVKFEPAEMPKTLKNVGAAFDKMDKKSAAVRIAKKNCFETPKKPNLYRTKVAPNNAAILDGLAFPTRRKRKATHNLLKELAAGSKRRESVKVKPKLKKIVKRAHIKPKGQVHQNVKRGISLEPDSSEYAKDEMQMAKLASEILKKKILRSAFEVKSRDRSLPYTEEGSFKIHKQPKNIVSLERPRSSQPEFIGKDRKSRSARKSSDVMSKLMSMPHVRHQVENFEMPLGPLEVQPGLSQFNYSKVGIFSPMQNVGSWASPVFNEYSRSNGLPSLRDTRETFYLEEHPS